MGSNRSFDIPRVLRMKMHSIDIRLKGYVLFIAHSIFSILLLAGLITGNRSNTSVWACANTHRIPHEIYITILNISSFLNASNRMRPYQKLSENIALMFYTPWNIQDSREQQNYYRLYQDVRWVLPQALTTTLLVSTSSELVGLWDFNI